MLQDFAMHIKFYGMQVQYLPMEGGKIYHDVPVPTVSIDRYGT